MSSTEFISKQEHHKKLNYLVYAVFFIVIIGLPTVWYAGYHAGRAQAGGSTPVFEHPAGPYSYLIWVDSGTYYAKNGSTGAIDYTGTNASQVIYNAFETHDKTSRVLFKVALVGDFPDFNGQIILHNRTVLDLTAARINLTDSFNKTLITNWWNVYGSGNDYYDNDITIIGGKINGNKAGQASGGIIYFNNGSEFRIRGTFLWNGKDYNARFDNIVRSTFEFISLDSDGDGAYFNTCAQIIADISAQGNDVNLRLAGTENSQLRGAMYASTGTDAGVVVTGLAWSTTIDFSVTYSSGNGIRLAQAVGLTIRGSASFNDYHGIRLEGSNYTTIEAFYLRSNGQDAASTYDDVFLTNYNGGGSFYNKISAEADSTDAAWNIEEGGASNWNLIHNSFTFQSNGIKMANAEASSKSRITASYNGTSWISSWGTG